MHICTCTCTCAYIYHRGHGCIPLALGFSRPFSARTYQEEVQVVKLGGVSSDMKIIEIDGCSASCSSKEKLPQILLCLAYTLIP